MLRPPFIRGAPQLAAPVGLACGPFGRRFRVARCPCQFERAALDLLDRAIAQKLAKAAQALFAAECFVCFHRKVQQFGAGKAIAALHKLTVRGGGF